MQRIAIGLLLLLAGFATAPPAGAGSAVLTTPPVLGDRVTCLFANAGSKPVTVTVELVGATTFTLTLNETFGPGGFAAWGMGDDEIAYCRFTISSGKPEDVRASACGIAASLDGKCATTAVAW